MAAALQASASSGNVDDCTFKSTEFIEYEAEFCKYMQDNLRAVSPQEDYMEILSDDPVTLAGKITLLTEWWRAAHGHVVVFTGAGISTAAGLPDYRGPEGIWTRKLLGHNVSDDIVAEHVMQVQPTAAHMVLMRLHAAGLLSYIATTNVDGLHRKSGLPLDVLSELHGNLWIEECAECLHEFERNFVARNASGLRDHLTGRKCEECGGALRDNIVNFGNTVDDVPSMEEQHDRTWVQCLKAELVVVFGSSLSVPTACDLPQECLDARYDKPNGGRLVVVNLQRTPKDSLATACIRAPCDTVLLEVEKRLTALR